MVNLILFCLSVIGLTHIIVDGSIFFRPREWLRKKLPPKVFEVFTCYQCCGCWAGFVSGAILVSFNPFVIFMCGCAGSFLANLGADILNYLEARAIVDTRENK